MTHTPGPWKKDGLKVIAGTRGTICVCPVVSLGGVFNVEANARLIAAAPELLDALKKIAKGTCVMGNGNQACPIEIGDYYWCYPHIAQQALALVEGDKDA